jgi:hypothetical protein
MENNNGNWKLGGALENYMNLLQQIGSEGVEDRLKRIREATFKRMRNHKNNSLSWQQILKMVAEMEKEKHKDTA